MIKLVIFQIRSNPQGQYYLPKEVRQELGEQLDLICDTKTAVIYNQKTKLNCVLKSLKVLCMRLENRLELEKQEHNPLIAKTGRKPLKPTYYPGEYGLLMRAEEERLPDDEEFLDDCYKWVLKLVNEVTSLMHELKGNYNPRT
jgi:hypothetical protein